MSKLNGADNLQDAIFKLSEGNPGAVTALLETLKLKGQDVFLAMLHLDTQEVYGGYIWVLFKDHCGCDPNRFFNLVTTQPNKIKELSQSR